MQPKLKVINPRTGTRDCDIVVALEADISQLAEQARKAQTAWRGLPLEKRCTALLHFADRLESHSPDITKALEVDTGRRRLAQTEVLGVIANIRNWASIVPSLAPDTGWAQGRSKPQFQHKNTWEPYGLVGIISPWNFPMTLSFIDAIPALLAGACVIIKPSEITPRFANVLQPIIAGSELASILNIIQGDGQTGALLIDHVDCICFTGSVSTGRKVAMRAAENLIPANLELGGKDPLIITENAGIDQATTLALRASVLATGQACQSIERIYVPENIHDNFVKVLTQKALAVRLNTPDISEGHIGPFIYSQQAEIVSTHIADAVAKGAVRHCGGDILRHGGGYWMEPTVLSCVTHDMKIMCEETFGPVMPVMAYGTIDEAIALANDTNFGLSAAVFAGHLEEAEEIGQHIGAGAISLMDAALTGQYFEAGKQSFKQSGLGASRMGAEGFLRFFRQKAYIANTQTPLELDDFSE